LRERERERGVTERGVVEEGKGRRDGEYDLQRQHKSKGGRETENITCSDNMMVRGGEHARALSLFCALARAGARAHTQGKCRPSKQQRIAVRCSVLQWVAVCCGVVQFVGVRCSVPQCGAKVQTFKAAACCSALQCVAVRCSVLQCVAVCCSALQCVAV